METPDSKTPPSYGPSISADANGSRNQPSNTELMPAEVRDRVFRSANWFFWIAGLSLINSIATHLGGNWHFFLGLGITAVADAVAQQIGGIGPGLALVFDLIGAGIFVGIGLLARRMMLWAFVVGMVAYGLDGVVLLMLGEYLSAGFHGYVLYSIYLGVNALRQQRMAAG
ncbi:MAG: hypothetical protein ACJ74G_01395 [Blastocatellia bacterium]